MGKISLWRSWQPVAGVIQDGGIKFLLSFSFLLVAHNVAPLVAKIARFAHQTSNVRLN